MISHQTKTCKTQIKRILVFVSPGIQKHILMVWLSVIELGVQVQRNNMLSSTETGIYILFIPLKERYILQFLIYHIKTSSWRCNIEDCK